MSSASLAFLTPYWSGEEMMRIHLASIRQFHPEARIIVSKKGGGREEMERWRGEFGVEYRLEECSYIDAYLRLLDRCDTRFVCFLDHDAVLLSGLDPYVKAIAAGEYDLLGVEEVIREAPGVEWQATRAEHGGWLRYAPGCVASNVILFDWHAFRAKHGLKGILGTRRPGMHHFEFDYGIGQRLPRHKYLRPYHAKRYGLGNLLQDGDRPVAWHQWYGSHRTRLTGAATEAQRAQADGTAALAEAGERAFLHDHPTFDFAGATPAWGAGEAPPPPAPIPGWRERLRRWADYGLLGMLGAVRSKVERAWRFR